jgi:hypothetical protein
VRVRWAAVSTKRPIRSLETSGRHPRRTVEHFSEIVTLLRFGLAGRDPHPYRHLQRGLGSDGGVNRGAHAGMVEVPGSAGEQRRLVPYQNFTKSS